MSAEIEKLDAQITALKEKKKAFQARERERWRKVDARCKILLGGGLLRLKRQGAADALAVYERIASELEERDRQVFEEWTRPRGQPCGGGCAMSGDDDTPGVAEIDAEIARLQKERKRLTGAEEQENRRVRRRQLGGPMVPNPGSYQRMNLKGTQGGCRRRTVAVPGELHRRWTAGRVRPKKGETDSGFWSAPPAPES